MTDGIAKARTGIDGFDDVTLGGLPRGRPTLVCGSAGCGKTLFASTFLVNGARDEGEPGIFVTFEERPGDIVDNVASLGFTNAVKYGALSNDTGLISITAASRDDMLDITWQESGGPAVVTPGKSGFGQTVIARGLGVGGTQVEFRPEGIVCRMSMRQAQSEAA